nr:immunoglobulin light chain junction region [Macaca mulatta]MOW04939.1 immunoglobulin light chain junction region [Macaca mulatta]MOW05313.1 immunoglobulin light chain junction region [Macaca mulatta]MOW06598.1 immunoglobulin light chain junction region [Macaca mulatta]
DYYCSAWYGSLNAVLF